MTKDIESSFKQTLVSDSIDVVKDYVEVGLDSILSDGVLKDIPLVSTLVSVYKLGATLKDRHTFKKIAIFLNRLSDIPLSDREKFVNRLAEDDEYNESVSEKVLLTIERLDETRKAEIIGNLFKLYVMEILVKEQFFRLVSIVERAFINDLILLSKSSSAFRPAGVRVSMDTVTKISLTSLGIYQQKIDDRSSNNKDDINLVSRLTPTGRELANYMYYDLNDPKFAEQIKLIKNNPRRR